MIVNQSIGFSKLSMPRIKGMITVLKNLTPGVAEREKVWFIEIAKIFQEKNLKIFYLPLASLQKLLVTKQFNKLPDPMEYFVGITYQPTGGAKEPRLKPEVEVQRKESVSVRGRNSVT